MNIPTEAIERLRLLADGDYEAAYGPVPEGWTFDDWMDLRTGNDRESVADYLLSLLPGPRPEPIDSHNAEVGQSLWCCDEDGETCCGTVVQASIGLKGIQWKDSVGYNDEGFPTEADATLAAIYEHFDRIGELAEQYRALTTPSNTGEQR